MDPLIVFPIIISIGPVIVASLINNGKDNRLWFSYIFGMAGWYIALVLRIPILMMINFLDKIVRIISASLLAGVFEETTRFFSLRYIMKETKNPKAPISFGLGWGFSEAVLIYVINVLVSSSIYGYSWIEFLPGAFERNTACIFHTAMAMLLGYSIIRNKTPSSYLSLAIILHGFTNILPYIISFYYTNNTWIIELVLFITVVIITLPIILIYKKLFYQNSNLDHKIS